MSARSQLLLEAVHKNHKVVRKDSGAVSVDGERATKSNQKLFEHIYPTLEKLSATPEGKWLSTTLVVRATKDALKEKTLSLLQKVGERQRLEKVEKSLESLDAPSPGKIQLFIHPTELKNGKPTRFLAEITPKGYELMNLSPEALEKCVGPEVFGTISGRARIGATEYLPFGDSHRVDEQARVYSKRKLGGSLILMNNWLSPDFDYDDGSAYFPDILKEYIEYLMNGDPEQVDIILWILYMYVHGLKTSNIFYWLGAEGIGKTIFFERLVKTMLGDHNVKAVNFQKMNETSFNAELDGCQVAYNDETKLDKETTNLLKSLTNETFLASAKYKTPEIKKAAFSIHVLANPTDVVIPLPAKSRRNIALDLPTIQLEIKYGREKTDEIYNSLTDKDVVAPFVRWLRKEYKPKYPIDGSEVRYKNPHYFELVLQSYRNSYENNIVEAFVNAGNSDNQTVRPNSIKNRLGKAVGVPNINAFLEQWREAGLVVGTMETDPKGKISYISHVKSREDFYKATGTPIRQYDDDLDLL